MFLKSLFFIFVGILCFGFQVLFAASPDHYFIREQKDIGISLGTKDKTGAVQFSFEKYNIPAPTVCKQDNIVCHETMTIKAHVEKQWEVIPVPSLWNPELTPQKLAEYYPDLPENKSITDGSSPQQKWLVQRILYERGLLDAFPTGKIGYKTEEAVAKLQYLKGIEEVDTKKNIILIGPKTIKELNKLKAKMKDPNFVARSPLPLTPTDQMTPAQQKRLADIQKLLDSTIKAGTSKISESTPQKRPIFQSPDNGDMLQFFGEAKIQSGGTE